MAEKQVALVQVRSGLSSQLPDSLEEFEFGTTTDNGGLYIGTSINDTTYVPRIRSQNNIYPYNNVEVLTERSDNLNIIKHNYIGYESSPIVYPTIVNGLATVTTLTTSSTISINGINVTLTNNGLTLDDTVSAINNTNIPNIIAHNNNGLFCLVNLTGSSITLSNVLNDPLQRLQLTYSSTDTTITYPSSSLYERTLQSVLDDTINAKAFNVLPTTQDNSLYFNGLFSALYLSYSKLENYRITYLNSGKYYINTRAINLPPYCKLKGEGSDRTIIYSTSSSNIVSLMDGRGVLDTQLEYGTQAATQPSNIVISDITFQHSLDYNALNLYGGKDITFERCKFISGGNSNSILAHIKQLGYNDISNIKFIDCEFDTSNYGIYINTPCSSISVIRCSFKNIYNQAIYINGTSTTNSDNILVKDCYFKDCAINTNNCIYFGSHVTNSNITGCKFANLNTVQPVVNYSNTSNYDNVVSVVAPVNETTIVCSTLCEDCYTLFDYVLLNGEETRTGKLSFYVDSSLATNSTIVFSDSCIGNYSSSFIMRKTNDGVSISLLNNSTLSVTLRYGINNIT